MLDALTGSRSRGFAWSPDGKYLARVLPGLNEQQIAIYSLGNLARQYVSENPTRAAYRIKGNQFDITGYVDYNAGLAGWTGRRTAITWP